MNDNVESARGAGPGAGGESVGAELLRRNQARTELNETLSRAHEQLLQPQLLQSERRASIGQPAASVAHEINDPISFGFSNFGAPPTSLHTYTAGLPRVLPCHEQAECHIADTDALRRIASLREQVDLDVVVDDVRLDTHQDWQWSNLHHGIDSTPNIVNHEVKYEVKDKARIAKAYGEIPDVECRPSHVEADEGMKEGA